MEQNRLYTLAEVEELTTVTRRTLYNWINTGYLQAVKLGGRWKVSPGEVDRITGGALKPYGRRTYKDGKPVGYTQRARERRDAQAQEQAQG